VTPAQLEQMARAAGLLHGPADDDRARLMLAALGIFRASVLEEAARVAEDPIIGELPGGEMNRLVKIIADEIRALAKQEGGDKPC
jgi:hypothetical protein